MACFASHKVEPERFAIASDLGLRVRTQHFHLVTYPVRATPIIRIEVHDDLAVSGADAGVTLLAQVVRGMLKINQIRDVFDQVKNRLASIFHNDNLDVRIVLL